MSRASPSSCGRGRFCLIAYGTSILAIITASLQYPTFFIDENSLATSIGDILITIGGEDMPHGCKGNAHSRRDRPPEGDSYPAHDTIARCLNSFLHVHSKIDHVECYLHVALDLHITTHHTVTQPWSLILQDHRWNDGLEGSLARLQDIWVIRISDKTCTTIL